MQWVWKIEWSESLSSCGAAERMIAEVCYDHSQVIFAHYPAAVGCGSYHQGSCEYCEREAQCSQLKTPYR